MLGMHGNFSFLLMIVILLICLKGSCQKIYCSDYYIYKQQSFVYTTNDHGENLQKPYENPLLSSHGIGLDEIPWKEGFVVIPFLNQKLLEYIKPGLISNSTSNSSNSSYAQRQDYYVPICYKDEVLVAQLDLQRSKLTFRKTLFGLHSLSEFYAEDEPAFKEDIELQESFDFYFNKSYAKKIILNQEQYLGSHNFALTFSFAQFEDVNSEVDGLFGLAFPQKTESSQSSFFYDLYDNYRLQSSCFSFCLSSDTIGGGGYLIFGGLASSILSKTSDTSWIQFNVLNSYNIKGTGLMLEESTIAGGGDSTTETYLAVMDPTQTHLLLPQGVLEQLAESLKEKACSGPFSNQICGNMLKFLEGEEVLEDEFILEMYPALLTPLYLYFSHEKKKLEISDYIFPCNKSDIIIDSGKQKLQYCTMIRPNPSSSSNEIVLGSLVLKQYYIIVDQQSSRLGFASKQFRDCDIIDFKDLGNLNEDAVIRLSLNICLLIALLFIGFKVTGGCIQFYDIVNMCCDKAGPSQLTQEQLGSSIETSQNNNNNNTQGRRSNRSRQLPPQEFSNNSMHIDPQVIEEENTDQQSSSMQNEPHNEDRSQQEQAVTFNQQNDSDSDD